MLSGFATPSANLPCILDGICINLYIFCNHTNLIKNNFNWSFLNRKEHHSYEKYLAIFEGPCIWWWWWCVCVDGVYCTNVPHLSERALIWLLGRSTALRECAKHKNRCMQSKFSDQAAHPRNLNSFLRALCSGQGVFRRCRMPRVFDGSKSNLVNGAARLKYWSVCMLL